jgi:hypothetical protein
VACHGGIDGRWAGVFGYTADGLAKASLMTTFKVWDDYGDQDGDCSVEVVSISPIDAAEHYARKDPNGCTDGVYDDDGADIAVMDVETGAIVVYTVVWVDHPPWLREQLREGAALRAVKMVRCVPPTKSSG